MTKKTGIVCTIITAMIIFSCATIPTHKEEKVHIKTESAITNDTPKPTVKVTPKPTAKATTKPAITTPNKTKSYNGIKVGDIIDGKLYRYTVSLEECGKTNGVTASGFKIWNGMPDPHIVACNWLPLGAVVEVNGVRYTVLDKGGSGLSIIGNLDVFTPQGREVAIKLGVQKAKIKIISLP